MTYKSNMGKFPKVSDSRPFYKKHVLLGDFFCSCILRGKNDENVIFFLTSKTSNVP